MNNDGFDDVVVGTGGRPQVSVFAGGPNGTSPMPMTSFSTNQDGSGPTTVAVLGDVNGDAFADIGVGNPYQLGGLVWVYTGGSTGVVTNPASLLSAPDGPGSGFGTFVAFRSATTHPSSSTQASTTTTIITRTRSRGWGRWRRLGLLSFDDSNDFGRQ
jgi:hypothetical protein